MQPTSTRERDGVLVGAGAGLILIVLLVLQSFIGSGLLSTRTVTSTTTVTTTSTAMGAYEQVAGAYENYLSMLNSSEASALQSDYERNATVVWTGASPGLAGTYTGSSNIEILLSQFLAAVAPKLAITNETHTIDPEGSTWIVDSRFDFAGNSTIVGTVSGIIAANCSYTDNDNSWLISRQVWNFLEYDTQYPPG